MSAFDPIREGREVLPKADNVCFSHRFLFEGFPHLQVNMVIICSFANTTVALQLIFMIDFRFAKSVEIL